MAEPFDDGDRAFERALGLRDLAGETEAERAVRLRIEMRLAPLMEVVEPATPSTDLFSRIAAEAGIAAPLPGFHVTGRDEGTWKSIAEGVETRTLWLSRRSGRRSFLLRMQPGAILPEHDHGGDEECYVLEGDMQVDGVSFGPGDFQVAFAGTRHPLVTTRGGCLCLLSVGL